MYQLVWLPFVEGTFNVANAPAWSTNVDRESINVVLVGGDGDVVAVDSDVNV